jgi:hypothetical protein
MPDAAHLQHAGEGAAALLVDGVQHVVADILGQEGGKGDTRLHAGRQPLQPVEQQAAAGKDHRHAVQQPSSRTPPRRRAGGLASWNHRWLLNSAFERRTGACRRDGVLRLSPPDRA